MTNTSSYVSYAGLLIGVLNHFGFIVSSNDVTTIIAGVITLVGIIWGHYNHTQVVAAATRAGVSLS